MLEKLPDAVGHALRNIRAGLDHIAFNLIDLRTGTASITVSSLAFHDHGPIPSRYTADGEGMSPPLSWSGIPAQAESLLLLVEDADAPTPHPLVHAIVAGIAPEDGALPEGGIDPEQARPTEAGAGESSHGPDVHLRIGRNSYLQTGWLPPDPPPGHGVHRYAFQVFALGPGDDLPATPGRDAVLDAIRNRGIASGYMIGTFERPDGSIKIDDAEVVNVTAPGAATA
jgi:Raf kinase inhibitor-like YbhB/YbcL family protein